MRKSVFLLGMACLISLALVRVLDPYPVQVARNVYFDQLQRLSPRDYVPLPIRVVDIDEASLATLGQWPWPRNQLAALVDRLSALGAAAIVFDMLFADADRLSPSQIARDTRLLEAMGQLQDFDRFSQIDNDAIFADAIRDRAVVFGVAAVATSNLPPIPGKSGIALIGHDPAAGLPEIFATTSLVPSLREAAAGIGSVNISPNSTATVIRQIPLIWRTESGALPSLTVEALRVAQGESTVVVHGSSQIKGVVEAVRVGSFEIPTTDSGQLWVRYRYDNAALYLSAMSVLDDQEYPSLRAAIDGHIVLVGTSAPGLLDIRTTPLGENVPGVSIHAQVLEQIMLGEFLLRSEWIEGFELTAYLALGVITVLMMSFFGALLSLAVAGIVTLIILLGSWVAFQQHGILFDVSFPIGGGTITFLAVTSFQYLVADRDRRLIRSSFSHYVAPTVLQQIEKSGHRLGLGGEIRDVTVMFADIRNFTSLSEMMQPDHLVQLLNNLFGDLGEHILDEQGTIDKFIGDSIMAFWNAPLETEHYQTRACLSALRIRKALERFNKSGQVGQASPIALAIGISSGGACVGNIGSRSRFNYSVIGDIVNLAARIEASCRWVGYDVLICQKTADEAADLAILSAGNLILKGKSGRTGTYILIGNADLKRQPAFRELCDCHAKLTEALSSGRDGSRYLDQCKRTGARIDKGLLEFYGKIPSRLEDFELHPA